MVDQIGDPDIWDTIDPDDLWIYDKLIVSRKLGYVCGPAGVPPPVTGRYIVRPCVNFRMMSAGAEFINLTPDNHDQVPHGYFWCEVFSGRPMSFDYHWGKQVLAVEGFREDPNRLDRFSRWEKIQDFSYILPAPLQQVANKYEWLNVEVIGGKIIEVHLRYNDDFRNHTGTTIIPVWKDEFYSSDCGDRLGFIIKDDR